MAENSHKALKKKRVKKLLNKLLKDTNILDIYTKKMKKCGIVGASIVLTIQRKLKKLREKKSLFNNFNQYTDIKQLDLGQCY